MKIYLTGFYYAEGYFWFRLFGYERGNPPKTTREVGLALGIPDGYNFDGVLDRPS